MPIGIGSGLWGVIIPSETTNLVTNPSGEFGTTGWSVHIGGGIGTTSQYQQYGAWSGTCEPSSNGTAGVQIDNFTLSDGSVYGVSCSVRGASGIPYNIMLTNNGGVTFLGSVSFTGGGTWARYGFNYTEGGGGVRRLYIRKASSADVSPFYFDGAQVELGSITTYTDGDQAGGTWLGAPHASQSYRSGQYRGGGSIVALADIGLSVDQFPGAGVMPIENSAQSYAVTDGAQFQRQRAASRTFTLTAKPIVGTSLADFHVTRRTLWDVFKPDLVTPQQPISFLYYGGQGTIGVQAYYAKGLELGNMDGPIAENAAISFAAYDPYWYFPTQQGTTLAPRAALGSVNYLAKRSPQGQWGTMGIAGTTIGYSVGGQLVRALAVNGAGTLFIGGQFGTLGGTLSPMIGMYNPTTNRFGTLTGGTIPHDAGGVLAFAQNPNGTLFFGGQFITIAGTSHKHIGQWTGAFGTLIGGTIAPTTGQVETLLFSPTGTLFLGGIFGTVSGTANTFNLAQWNGAYGSFAKGVGTGVGESVNALAWGLDNQTLFIGGNYLNIGGTIGTSIGFFKNGVFGTMGNVQAAGGAGFINTFAVGPNGVLYEAGLMDHISGVTINTVAAWNGVQHSPLGNGVNSLSRSIIIDPVTGNLLVAGSFTQAGSINVASQYAEWNGAAWLLPDITVGPTIYEMAYGLDNTLYIGGDFAGTAYAASIGTLINKGRAAAYPTLRLRNRSASGTARLYQLLNTTTGDGLYFNYTMIPGEQAVLTLQPGSRSFQSSAFGNIFGKILPGSNLATFNLLSGTNFVSFFSDNDSLEASFFWQPRGASIDGGTVL